MEQEKRFEAITPYTYEEYKRLNKFHMHTRRKVSFIFLVCCVIVICLAAIGLILLKDYFSGILYLILGIVGACFLAKAPDIATARLSKSDKIIGTIENDISFYDDHFCVENNQSTSKVNYNQLYQAFESDTTFYLYINRMSVYIVSKKGFKLGNAKEFRKFMTSKLKDKFKIKCK